MSHNLIKVGLEMSLLIMSAQETWNTVLSSLLICTNSQRRTQIDFPFMLHLICHSPITLQWIRASINKAGLPWDHRTGTQSRGNDLMLVQLSFCLETPTICFLTWSLCIIQKVWKGKFFMEYFLESTVCCIYAPPMYKRDSVLLAWSSFEEYFIIYESLCQI